jgi:hypothetical protein
VAAAVAVRLMARVVEKAAPAAAVQLTDQHKAIQEHGLLAVVAAVAGTMDQVVVVVVDPALLLSVIKTYIKRNNNFFLIV